MGEIRSIKPVAKRETDPRIIADLEKILADAKEGRIHGYSFVFHNNEGWGFLGRIESEYVWEYLGFHEAKVKPTMIGIVNGQI